MIQEIKKHSLSINIIYVLFVSQSFCNLDSNIDNEINCFSRNKVSVR